MLLEAGSSVPSRRATVRLRLECNNRCVFCSQDGLRDGADPNVDAELGARLERARATSDEVTFVGGEPTLDERLSGSIRRARELGFRRVGLQTNGSRLGDTAYTAALARAGLTDVHLSIHGGDAAVHDYHTGRPGSFGEALGAIETARAHDLLVVVTTVLTRSNFRVLGAIPPVLAGRGVAGWLVSVPALAGRAATDRDRVAPRLGLALPFVLHALSHADGLRLPSWILGAPLCLLGPFATRALGSDARAFAPVCDACPARPACPGVDRVYLARFAGDELSARDLPPPAMATALTAMFVGPGELAPAAAPPEAPPAAPARGRTSLPLLGKVKPAIAEATSGTERRTGGALKEIFPALFEAAPAAGDDDPRT